MLAAGRDVRCQAADAVAVLVDDARVEGDRRHRLGFRAPVEQPLSLGFAGGERFANFGEIGAAVGDRRDQARDRAIGGRDATIDGVDLRRAFAVRLLDLGVIAAHQVRDGFGLEQLLGDAAQNACFELGAPDLRPVLARPRFAGARATDMAVGHDRHGAVAGPATHQPGQQISGTILLRRRPDAALLDLVLRFLPHRFADDAQLGHLDEHALGAGVGARDATARLGVAPHVHAVVEVAAGVDRVAQHADEAIVRAHDGRSAPFAAAGRSNAISVELLGDRLGAAAGVVLVVDAADDDGLVLVDLAQTAIELAVGAELVNDVIAVGQAARHAATTGGAALPTAYLVGEVLEEERAHRALHADVQFVDAAFGQRLDRDVGELETLEDRGDVGLIARDAVDRLGQDDVEGAGLGVGEHRRHAGPPVAGARDRGVGVDVDDFPALARGVGAAGRDLVLGRVGGLEVGRESGVDGATWHGSLLESQTAATSSAAIWRAIASTRARTAGVMPLPALEHR